MTSLPGNDQDLLASRVRMPEQVMCREFPDETVVLNLETGMYHGLNPTASRMLETLRSSPSVKDAIVQLVAEFSQPHEVIERDVLELCRSLGDRGLLHRDGP